MSLVDLKSVVAQTEPWKSFVLARVGGANIKVMRMDGEPYPDESHDYPEGFAGSSTAISASQSDRMPSRFAPARYLSFRPGLHMPWPRAVPVPWSYLTHEARRFARRGIA